MFVRPVVGCVCDCVSVGCLVGMDCPFYHEISDNGAEDAIEEYFELPERQSQATGVMMIPTARAGRLIEVLGLDEAKAVSGIEDVAISAHLGQRLIPLPEGSRYLGFIFARADSPQAVEAALRESHFRLEFVIEPLGEHGLERGGEGTVGDTDNAGQHGLEGAIR